MNGGVQSHVNLLKAQGPRSAYHDEYYTPAPLVKSLGRFDLDPCAAETTRHAKTNWRKKHDGLNRAWRGRVWLNAPYSTLDKWLEKFIAHGNGIALVNARCETKWFQQLAAASHAVLFPNFRIKFFDGVRRRVQQPTIGSALFAIGGGEFCRPETIWNHRNYL